MTILESSLKQCALLRANLIGQCHSEDEAMAVATAFALEAKTIWAALGGNRHVAAQFYHLADTFATKKDQE